MKTSSVILVLLAAVAVGVGPADAMELVEGWNLDETAEFQTVPSEARHRWGYRGQIVPGCQRVEVCASITAVDDQERTLMADGFLSVDGRTIYSMNDFSLGAC